MHFIDPIELLKVGAEHEDGKEVDAQFWIVHVSERNSRIMKTTCLKPCEVKFSLCEENLPLNLKVTILDGFPENVSR